MSSLAKEFGVKLPPKPPKEESVKKTSISPFAFVEEIYFGKKNIIIDTESEKQYNAFMVNLALSFGPDTILLANEMNIRWQIDRKMQNDYLRHVVSKKKRFRR